MMTSSTGLVVRGLDGVSSTSGLRSHGGRNLLHTPQLSTKYGGDTESDTGGFEIAKGSVPYLLFYLVGRVGIEPTTNGLREWPEYAKSILTQ
jgi:hypothetical protein